MAKCETGYWDTAYDAENTSTSKNDPLPNNNIKTFDINYSCLIEEKSIKYIMKKFHGLEQIRLDVWDLIDSMPKEVMTSLLAYISRISKFFMGGYLCTDEESKITELVTAFMENFISPPVENATFINARMVFEKTTEEDLDEMENSGGISVELKNHYDLDKDDFEEWSIAQYNDNDTVLYLDVESTRYANEIVLARYVFLEGFINEHGLRLRQLHFSTC